MQCGAGETQEPQNAVSSVEHGSLKVDGAAERLTLIDYDNSPTPGATRSGDTCEETDGRSSICPSSDSFISREQGPRRGSPDLLAVPVSDPEIRYVL